MRIRKKLAALGMALLVAVALAATVTAVSVTIGGVTLTYPDYPISGPGLLSCEPWAESTANNITLTDLPLGSDVTVSFAYAAPFSGDLTFLPDLNYYDVTNSILQVPIPYPTDTTLWPIWDQTTNAREISFTVFVFVFRPDGTYTTLSGRKWWVRCLPPPQLQGCTPGYWKQKHHFDSWVPTGYAPTDDFETVFGVDASFSPHTLVSAVWLGRGGEYALARHAVAALLNAASPNVDYAYTVAEVIAGVQNAYATGDFESFKTQLDFANNAGCPLN